MGVSFTSDFLFGVIIGAVLVMLAQPLFRSFGKVTRFLPLILLIAAVLFALYLWLGR